MTLRTAFTELSGIEAPIVPGADGRHRPAGPWRRAVSDGGGLGLVGCGREDRGLPRARAGRRLPGDATKPWVVGFQSWSTTPESVEMALAFRPHAVMLSFGDPRPLATPVLDAGVPLIVQVTDLAEAEVAADLGAALFVAQGSEAGGHSGAGRRCRSCRSSSISLRPSPCCGRRDCRWPRHRGPLCASAPPAHCLAHASRPPVRRSWPPRYVKAILDGSGATPSATGRSTSLGVRRGRVVIWRGRCATTSWNTGAAGTRSSNPTRQPKPITRRARPSGTWR